MTTTINNTVQTNNNKKGVVAMTTKNVNMLTVNFSVEGTILRTAELHNLTKEEVIEILKEEVFILEIRKDESIAKGTITVDFEDNFSDAYYQDAFFIKLQVILEKVDAHRYDEELFLDDFENPVHRQALSKLESIRGDEARKVEEIEVIFSKDGQEIDSVEIENLKRSTVLSALDEMGVYKRALVVKGGSIYVQMEQLASSELNTLKDAYIGGLVALDLFALDMNR